MNRRDREHDTARTSGASGYWMSLSDLMAGLVILLALLMSCFMLRFAQERELYSAETRRWATVDSLRTDLLRDLQEQLQTEEVTRTSTDSEHGVVRLPEGILFASGEASITAEGRLTIAHLAQALEEVLGRPEYAGRIGTIFIEGHTDSVPVSRGNQRFADNWDLSTKRATNTWRELAACAPGLAQMRNRQGERIFSCTGYGETRPADANDTEEGRQRNRRIDLRFAMLPPEPIDTTPQVTRVLEGRLSGATPPDAQRPDGSSP